MTLTANHGEINRLAVTIALHKNNDDRLEETQALVEFVMRYAFYAALTAIFLMVIALIVKLMWNCDGDETSSTGSGTPRPTENTRLLWSKEEIVVTIYGTSEKDLDSGSTSSSEDLYDAKICVICYDDQRNCFFVPCGHCVTCHTCAHRIINDENKSCPICRGIIDKVRKLHIS